MSVAFAAHQYHLCSPLRSPRHSLQLEARLSAAEDAAADATAALAATVADREALEQHTLHQQSEVRRWRGRLQAAALAGVLLTVVEPHPGQFSAAHCTGSPWLDY